jgi:hypothetical protein
MTNRPEQNKSSVNNTSIYTYKWLHISEYKKPLSLMLFLDDIRQYKNLERDVSERFIPQINRIIN